MIEVKHTPGPWRVGDGGHTVFGPPNGNPSPQTICAMGGTDSRANAQFIVEACNAHDALVEALRVVHVAWETGVDARSRYAHVVRAALAKVQS